MSRRHRLLATLRGEAVDRPAVSFYELNGLDEDPADPDPFNIYSHPSWAPLIALARERTDRIVMRGMRLTDGPRALGHVGAERTVTVEDDTRFERQTLRTPAGTLTGRTRRDRDVNTVWVTEHLLKGSDDLRAVLSLPAPEAGGVVDTAPILEAEAALGDSGIVMIDAPDPLCLGAELFDMATYTIICSRAKTWLSLVHPRFMFWGLRTRHHENARSLSADRTPACQASRTRTAVTKSQEGIDAPLAAHGRPNTMESPQQMLIHIVGGAPETTCAQATVGSRLWAAVGPDGVRRGALPAQRDGWG